MGPVDTTSNDILVQRTLVDISLFLLVSCSTCCQPTGYPTDLHQTHGSRRLRTTTTTTTKNHDTHTTAASQRGQGRCQRQAHARLYRGRPVGGHGQLGDQSHGRCQDEACTSLCFVLFFMLKHKCTPSLARTNTHSRFFSLANGRPGESLVWWFRDGVRTGRVGRGGTHGLFARFGAPAHAQGAGQCLFLSLLRNVSSDIARRRSCEKTSTNQKAIVAVKESSS